MAAAAYLAECRFGAALAGLANGAKSPFRATVGDRMMTEEGGE